MAGTSRPCRSARARSALLPAVLAAAGLLAAVATGASWSTGGWQLRCFAAASSKPAVVGVEQPKRPLSAFFLWLQDNRAALQKELGTSTPTLIGKAAGEKWQALPDSKKKPFVAKAEAAKAEYAKALEAFKASGGVVTRARKEKTENKEKKAKDPNAPKRPLSAFFLWLQESRASIQKELGTSTPTLIGKAAGEKWQALPDSKKKPFVAKAEAAKAEYAKAVEAYKKTAAEGGAAQAPAPAPAPAPAKKTAAKKSK